MDDDDDEEEEEEEEEEDEEEEGNQKKYLAMLYELDDMKYINHGPYGKKETNFIMTLQNQNLPVKTVHDSIHSKVSIALKDIPACTELLENYWYDEENIFDQFDDIYEDIPDWYRTTKTIYGANEFLDNPPYRFLATTEANVGSF